MATECWTVLRAVARSRAPPACSTPAKRPHCTPLRLLRLPTDASQGTALQLAGPQPLLLTLQRKAGWLLAPQGASGRPIPA